MIRRALVCAAVLAAACSDPRPRPVPPTLRITLDTARVTSPGQIVGTIYTADPDGVDSLIVSLHSADDRFSDDSLFFPDNPFEEARPLRWRVPPGLASGVEIDIFARAVSYLGLGAADTATAIVRDSI